VTSSTKTRFEDHRERIAARSGMNQCDRRAIAVADQDRPPDLEHLEQPRQYGGRFVVHESDPMRRGERVRFAMTAAAVDERPASDA
jgi:hypothetical protein